MAQAWRDEQKAAIAEIKDESRWLTLFHYLRRLGAWHLSRRSITAYVKLMSRENTTQTILYKCPLKQPRREVLGMVPPRRYSEFRLDEALRAAGVPFGPGGAPAWHLIRSNWPGNPWMWINDGADAEVAKDIYLSMYLDDEEEAVVMTLHVALVDPGLPEERRVTRAAVALDDAQARAREQAERTARWKCVVQ